MNMNWWTWTAAFKNFDKFTGKRPIVKPNNNSVFSFSSTQQAQEGGSFGSKKKVNSFYRNGRLSKNASSWNEIFLFLNTQLSKNGGGVATFRSTSCEQWKDRTHHIPAWRSTSVGRWIAKPRWNLRSRQSISFLEEQ